MSSFVEASSKLEAVTRLSALAGASPETLGPGSKERKSLLVNLAISLDLDVDVHADKPALAHQLAAQLGETWNSDCWSAGHTITLFGLNRLLNGTHHEVQRRHAAAGADLGFHPARSKLEAVTRISSLTDGHPQTLGPGSKERKSVLSDLVEALSLPADIRLSKPELASEITVGLGGRWDETCWSTGQTITLEGLNRVLAAAERELFRRGSRTSFNAFDSPRNEAGALVAVLATSMPTHMDGRHCVSEMLAAESTHWAQDEWRGFYFEFRGLPALVNAFGGGPTSIANTTFDYSLGEIWDLKCHGDDAPSAILNSKEATDQCLQNRGLGLLVLTGTTATDHGEFREWQRELRVANGRAPRPRLRPAAFQRRSKSAFRPTRIDAYYISSTDELAIQLDQRVMGVMSQGRQVDGSARGKKYVLHTDRAHDSSIHIASLQLDPPAGIS